MDQSPSKKFSGADYQALQKAGIQAAQAHLKKDYCTQFADPFEWIREYAVNSYDAGASYCQVSISSGNGELTVYVSDNGHGMNRQRITDFFYLFRSRKNGDSHKMVGQFGVGKMSVAAIPGQKSFKVTTSTGTECWMAEAGNLLSDDPIRISRLHNVPPRGTVFAVTFTTQDTPEAVLKNLIRVLKKYTMFLPMKMAVHFPASNDSGGPVIEFIGQDWSAGNEYAGKSFFIRIAGQAFEVIMGIGQRTNEIYQKKVFITDTYNLLSYDLSDSIQIPHLRIRVNSSAFELPFGRHCLRNESILVPLAQIIRESLLPKYYAFLLAARNAHSDHNIFPEQYLEDITAALIIQIPDHSKKWCNVPVFRIFDNRLVSMTGLEKMVTKTGKIYMAAGENTGVDYSFFDGPVLMPDQPPGCIAFLTKCFKSAVINLSLNDVVIERPFNPNFRLTRGEQVFEASLGFSAASLQTEESIGLSSRNNYLTFPDQVVGNYPKYEQPEAEDAANAFMSLRWRVNYLVGRDGKTPCLTHRFIVSKNHVILNLYHSDIKDLLKISEKDPQLAGHWAVALCLTEDNRILSHLSPESREDLVLCDAILKLTAQTPTPIDGRQLNNLRKSIRDLLRDSGYNFDLN